MGVFERYLSVWVGLGILTGVVLGLWLPGLFQAVAALELARVNLVVAVFIWVMVYPMMIEIDSASIKDVAQRPRGLLLTLVINWLVKPFTMAALAVLFFEHIFAPWVDPQSASEYIAWMNPWSVLGLIATVVLLFGLQAQTLLDKPLVILMIAVPLVLQSYGIFAIAYLAAWKLRLPHQVAAPACMIGTSNFFELAVAVAISRFGLNSGAALATVVGVLVEVPVMLSLVAFANRTRHWFPQQPG